ncbi:MAG: hypothetical protein M3P18_07785 [Actinomycetota bacterium]|nr:hypothetical protein [Actinomycetota bacterium]
MIGGSNIFVVNVSTQNLARLTDATDSYSPSWSPDGSQIVFGSNRRGTQDIWVMDSDGSDQRPLTSDPAIDSAPSWLAP